ncbi:MAG: UDP-glucose--hexose-1-phosphate uridylyltransferase [Bacilli bacterium]|nr:UDP-glucose--hexose-1-phosphate uridylyltransferase [Bacilli bacterium]
MEKALKKLVAFACIHLNLAEEDALYVYQMLLGHYKGLPPYEGDIDEGSLRALDRPDEIRKELAEHLLKMGYVGKRLDEEISFLFGAVTPLPSKVNERFHVLRQTDPFKATEYLYNLAVYSDYVKKSAIEANVHFDYMASWGKQIEVSINLSKPEKKNSDIAKLLGAPKVSEYPPCALCYQNLGYYGDDKHADRSNLRFVEIDIEGEKWYLQFSPYGYFKRHCILFARDHTPMEISPRVFKALLGFVDLFPHYFIGSNADLPIVGGSILNHEHFQGGEHLLPLTKANMRKRLVEKGSLTVDVVDFPVSTLLVRSPNKAELLLAAEKILSCWRVYDDEENGIFSQTEGKKHNTTSLICRKEEGVYFLYMMLRNNRCDETYPDGIFHAHPDKFHIKSEGIGLIEAGGLFILPARLKRQMAQVAECVEQKYTLEEAKKHFDDIEPFWVSVEKIRETGESIEDYLGDVCQNILKDVAVFKEDGVGQAGIARFVEACEL